VLITSDRSGERGSTSVPAIDLIRSKERLLYPVLRVHHRRIVLSAVEVYAVRVWVLVGTEPAFVVDDLRVVEAGFRFASPTVSKQEVMSPVVGIFVFAPYARLHRNDAVAVVRDAG